MKHSTQLRTRFRTVLADTFTPVSVYLQIRDVFPNSILLESSDYHGNDNSCSYICCQSIASFIVQDGAIKTALPDGSRAEFRVEDRARVLSAFTDFLRGFSGDAPAERLPKFAYNGVFGYMNYDAARYCEDITLAAEMDAERQTPEIQFHLYRYIIAMNHFTNELSLIEHTPARADEADKTNKSEDSLESLLALISKKTFAQYRFALAGAETSNFRDEEFTALLESAKAHIYRGDVFQLVLSRRFQQRFSGDDFNVYRALRSVNPSPYLFYFDYGSMRLFGSSPEAQIVIQGGKAEIHPIAGTFRRTGDDATDARRAAELQADPKENAEHVMLVDLARNDLSRHCERVRVEVYKETQYYSHVIHLVSKVSGELFGGADAVSVVADTFPAGTLTGAPKYMAMTLIDRYERGARGFYGGAVGFFDFNGDVNLAIMIRSMMSKNNTLTYQAGAGLVAASLAESESQEVHNKLRALRAALALAETL